MTWLMMLINMAAIAVLALSVRLKNKKWLQAFLILLLLAGAGSFIPSELYRTQFMSSDAYSAYVVRTSQLFVFLRLAGWICLLAFVVGLRSLPATVGTTGEAHLAIPSAAGPASDPSRGGFVFPDDSRAALCERLKGAFPGRVEVAISEKRPNEIRVRDGLWRGASLKTADVEGKIRLTGITYDIPTFSAKIIIFIVSIVLFNIIMMILFSAATGQIRPGAFVLGGAAGFAMYTIIKMFFVASIRKSWAPEFFQGITRMPA